MPTIDDLIFDCEIKLAEANRSGTRTQRIALTSQLTQLRRQQDTPQPQQ